MGYRALSYTNADAKKATYFTNNNASTSAIFITAVEDLGGGLKAKAFGEADISIVKASLTNGATTNGGQAYTGAFFNSETYVGLFGNFGDLKLGSPNSYGLYASNTAQPFGTALGGGFSDTFGRMGTNANLGISSHLGNATTSRIIRNERSMIYETPVNSGFKGVVEFAAKNGKGTAQSAASATDGTTYASNNNGFFAYALAYNQGPLNAMFWSGKISAGDKAAAGTLTYSTAGVTAGKLTANQNVKYDIAAANYTTGALTIYGGLTKTKSSQTAAASATVTDSEDSSSSNIAAKYVVGQWDLLANAVKRKSNLATDATTGPNKNASLLGLGLNYNFSKNTLAYMRYEQAKDVVVNAGTALDSNTYGNQTITAVGLKMAF